MSEWVTWELHQAEMERLARERDELQAAYAEAVKKIEQEQKMVSFLLQELEKARQGTGSEAERERLRPLLAETWEWTSPLVRGKLGYLDLRQRVMAALEGTGSEEEPSVQTENG